MYVVKKQDNNSAVITVLSVYYCVYSYVNQTPVHSNTESNNNTFY